MAPFFLPAMYLGSFDDSIKNYDVIREMTADEIAQHAKFTPVVTEARNLKPIFVPNDVLNELGIKVVQSLTRAAGNVIGAHKGDFEEW